MIGAKQEQFDMQYILRPADYKFLTHDSFVNATRIERIKKDDLVESIVQGETKYVDRLKDCHIEELLDLVRGSRLFSKKDKEKYFY